MASKLQDTVDFREQQITSLADSCAALVQCARDVVMSGTDLYESSVAGGSVQGGPGAASNIRTAEWVSTLDLLRRDMRASKLSDRESYVPTVFSADGGHTTGTGGTSAYADVFGPKHVSTAMADEDSDDDAFEIDLAKAALQAGEQSFDDGDWIDAQLQLQESLTLMKELPAKYRAICDMFEVQYKLAVCTCHTSEPPAAESALVNLIQQLPSTDEHRRRVCDAVHLLAQVYIRMGSTEKLQLARSSCESALKGCALLLGRQHDSYLESLALLSRSYRLMNNPARAKACETMIPEAKRESLLTKVEVSQLSAIVAAQSVPIVATKLETELDEPSRIETPLSVTSHDRNDADPNPRRIHLHSSTYSSPPESPPSLLPLRVNKI